MFDRLVPHKGHYRHAEGNTDSHAKAVMVGASQVIFVEGGKLVLGTWQGVFLCEFVAVLRLQAIFCRCRHQPRRPVGSALCTAFFTKFPRQIWGPLFFGQPNDPCDLRVDLCQPARQLDASRLSSCLTLVSTVAFKPSSRN